MFKINDNYLKLPGSYLFSTIGKKVAAYQQANPDKEIIRLGIGDVTQPLAPAVIDALHLSLIHILSQPSSNAFSKGMESLKPPSR